MPLSQVSSCLSDPVITVMGVLLPHLAGTVLEKAAPPAVPAPPTVRHITSWILRDPASLDDDEQASLTRVRAQCPHPDALAGHVTEFAKILTGRRDAQLDAWIARASAGDQPDLRSFITGLKRDYQAVLNGLALPYISGKVESTCSVSALLA
jgi:transposase